MKDLIPILKAGLQEKGFPFQEKGEDNEKEKEKQRKEKILLLDGFPRDISQIKLTGMSDDDDEKEEEGLEFLQPDLVLFFDCPGEIAQKRYLSRGLPGRDVDVRIFERRFEEFERLNGEVVEEFEKRGILIRVSQSTYGMGGGGGDGFGEGCVEKGVLDPFAFCFLDFFSLTRFLAQIDTSQDTETSYRRLLRALRDSGYGLCEEVGGLEKGGGKETE